MRPLDLIALLSARISAGIKRPVHIESSPGIGKTQITAQVASQLGIGFMAIHAPLLQPEDYGFPVINAARTDVDFIVSTKKFPLEGTECPEAGILLIDEISQADSSAQKILANLVQEREIHGKRLKAGWIIVTTGNRVADRAGANRLLSHLKNRLTTIELDASIDDWSSWALGHGIAHEVIAFLRFRPALLSAFDAQADVNATPRSWSEGVAAALGRVPAASEFAVFRGDVGEGAAAEFCAFLKIFRKLPSPDAVILAPLTTEVPSEPATQYALCGALAHKASPGNFGILLSYVQRMPAEFSILFIRDALKISPKIAQTSEFVAWAAGAGAKLLI